MAQANDEGMFVDCAGHDLGFFIFFFLVNNFDYGTAHSVVSIGASSCFLQKAEEAPALFLRPSLQSVKPRIALIFPVSDFVQHVGYF